MILQRALDDVGEFAQRARGHYDNGVLQADLQGDEGFDIVEDGFLVPLGINIGADIAKF